jgi:hypothetical protein
MEEQAKTERRCKLLENDLTDTKAKLTRVQQEKMRVERDQQATMSLANALQGNNQSDVDYYKRKVCVGVCAGVNMLYRNIKKPWKTICSHCDLVSSSR